MIDKTTLWTVIICLAVGSFALRFSFLGLIGNRPLPEWLLRHLRYTAVSVIPALIAPLVLWPSATGGTPDPARLIAAIVTLSLSALTKRVFSSMAAGALVLVGFNYLS